MNKNNYNVIGVMSGTSLDGVDLALLNFRKSKQWEYQILEAETVPYPEEWKVKLTEAIDYSDPELNQLNVQYTNYLGEVVNEFIESNSIGDLDAICSHGHTVKHQPDQGVTLQIGNLSHLADLLGQVVVCDFRKQDVELGGQGAPLVPIGDELLFPGFDYCLNLGGFANISTRIGEERRAYDICAVNTVLNYMAGKLDLSFDKGGAIAASGSLDRSLLDRLNSLPFYRQDPPKSLGIEWVQQHILPMFAEMTSISCALKTYSIHAAIQIAGELKGSPDSKVLITGGGAYNSYLIEEIKNYSKPQLVIPTDKLVQFKEALIFGFLGVLRLRGEVNVLSSVTGAEKNHVSGMIFHPRH